ncbi:MAG: type II secretion system GspH family protein [Candidatus Pacebacteria bacterium]|nr:type II secretion system GspH family protein [Candidatus Paceibacterota bacterium]
MNQYKTQRGFTLIELLVVIAIIGVLSSAVLASLSTARTKAKYSAARLELQQISKAIVIAQGEVGDTVQSMTGHTCSRCACAAGTNIQNISSGTSCYQNWEHAITAIESAADDLAVGISSALRDPWGAPYLLDENEGENSGNPCRADLLYTAGEDGIRDTSDDYIVTIPFISSECQ